MEELGRLTEFIGQLRERGELKHLSTRRKRDYSLSSGERKGNSLNQRDVTDCGRCHGGVAGIMGVGRSALTESEKHGLVERHWKGRPEQVIAL